MLNIVRPKLPESCRVICVSDIHTHWRELDVLLQKCRYRAGEDFLFIPGDILERGEDNIAALRYVMELSKAPRVIVTGGNNDMFVHGLAVRYDNEKFMKRLENKPRACFSQMGAEIGITDFSENTSEKRRAVYEHFRAEIDFVMSLPDAVETERHIFVHAGIEGEDWRDMAPTRARLIPRFINLGHRSEKTVVCGHFPCYAIGRQNSNLPIFDSERRIIDIDGGAGVKPAAQLNALIIEKNGDAHAYRVEFQPTAPQRTVIADHRGAEGWIFADYIEHSFERLADSCPEGFAAVRNIETGETGVVPECMSGYWDDRLHVWGNLNSFPSVKRGEPVWVFTEYGEYCWCITASGEVGSVPKKIISSGE